MKYNIHQCVRRIEYLTFRIIERYNLDRAWPYSIISINKHKKKFLVYKWYQHKRVGEGWVYKEIFDTLDEATMYGLMIAEDHKNEYC